MEIEHPKLQIGYQYALDIVKGKIDACKFVKASCRNFLMLLKKVDKPDCPYYIDEKAAARVVNFCQSLKHVKGKLAFQNIRLEGWQVYFILNVYGVKQKEDGLRRYRECALVVPRKQGKSTFAACLCLYGAFGDGVKGAEVYVGATNEQQAYISFGIIRDMVISNPELKQAFNLIVNKETITQPSTFSKISVIIGTPRDGSSPSVALCDEVHEHKDSRLIDSLALGMGAREEPLLIITTTAGISRIGPCYPYVQTGRKIVTGAYKNERLFYLEYGIDEEDDWKDISVWPKAMPNYNVSVFPAFVESQYNTAMNVPYKRAAILTKILNVWSGVSAGFIDMEKWDACGDENLKIEDFLGEPCWVGLDLASRIDLTSMMIIFRRDECYYLFGKHYLPEETIDLPENEAYRNWVESGDLIKTEGARTDFRVVEKDLMELSENYAVQELAVDPREATMLMNEIQDWASFPCIEVTQSPANLSEPIKEFEALYKSGQLRHDANPILNWAASNVILKSTLNKSYMLGKRANNEKIDPIVAAIMALMRAMAHKGPEDESRFLCIDLG